MSNRQFTKKNKMQEDNYKQVSEIKYHEELTSHVPEYGASILDPNASKSSNMDDKSTK